MSRVLVLTFLSFSQIHGSRSMWSYMQKYMQVEDYTKEETGIANLVFLFTYGLAMNILSPVCCRISLKYTLAWSCIGTGMVFLALGLLELHNMLNYVFILMLMILNGVTQASSYPACIGILGNWFTSSVGMLMGVWAGCSNFGDVVGLLLGDFVIQRLNLQPSYGFITFAVTLLVIGIIDILFLVESPKSKIQEQLIYEDENETRPVKRINVITAWLLPGVALYAIGFACLKGTFMGFLFWLPSYFQNYPELERQSSYIAQMFDMGTFIGGVLIGYLGDKYRRRAVFIVPSLMVAIGLMLTVKYLLGLRSEPYYLVMLGIGIFQGGPYNNISGVISIELTKSLQNDKAAISVVSSLIEGIGTLTAAAFQVLIPYLGEDYLFLFFTGVTLIAEVVCIILLHGELHNKLSK